MALTFFQKIILGAAGVIATVIGCLILFAPRAFYAGYGIELGSNPNLMSELRAPGAGLTVLGLIMFAGILRQSWAGTSIAAALTVYLAYPFGRIVSMVFDGMPSGDILLALTIEIAVAALCLWAFRAPSMAPSRSTAEAQ